MFVLQSQNSQDSAVRLGAVALWKGRSSCRLAAFRHGTSQGWILPPAFPRFSCFLMFFFKASVLEWLPTFPHSYWNPFPGMRNRMVDQRAAGQSQKHPPQRERLELWVFDATYLYVYILHIYWLLSSRDWLYNFYYDFIVGRPCGGAYRRPVFRCFFIMLPVFSKIIVAS